MAHANARLTPAGRAVLCQRIAAGRPVAHVAAEMGISRTCAYRWWARYRQHGPAGLLDRPSLAHQHPRRTPADLEAAVLALRQARKLGPARIGPLVGLAPSTVYRVLCRHQLNRLTLLDPPSGRRIRRYEWDQPGELVHGVGTSGECRACDGQHACTAATQPSTEAPPRHSGHRIGYDYIHAVVDDHSRLAYAEVLADERGDSCAEFLRAPVASSPSMASPSSEC